MSDPFDPKTPLYQGQTLKGQQTPVQPEQAAASGFHFLEAGVHAVMAGLHFFTGGDDGEEGSGTDLHVRGRYTETCHSSTDLLLWIRGPHPPVVRLGLPGPPPPAPPPGGRRAGHGAAEGAKRWGQGLEVRG